MNETRYLLVLWTTSKCNLKCKYCYASVVPPMDMIWETAKSVINQFKSKALKIQFAGGEPLMNVPLIKQVCEYIPEAAFQMQTNATLINDDVVRLIKNYNISMGVSLDGKVEINEITRGKTTETIRGIKLLADTDIFVNLNAVVTKLNVNELHKIIDIALWLGNVGGIGLDLLRNVGRAKEIQLMPKSNEVIDMLHKLNDRSNEIYKLTNKKIIIREIEYAKKLLKNKIKSNYYCYASCGKSIVVLPNGEIYPCGSLISEDYRVDDIHNIKRLSTAPYNKCDNCKYNDFCPKGCPSRLIVNDSYDLDCALKMTSFQIAESELNL